MEDLAGMTRQASSTCEDERPRWRPAALHRFAAALRDFLRGFVGHTALPRETAAACRALDHQASGRGRCC
jgi:hypothetical protein